LAFAGRHAGGMVSRMTCSKCKYYFHEEESYGECRRYPPIIIHYDMDPKLTTHGWFPETYGDSWCGEFAAMQSKRANDTEITGETLSTCTKNFAKLLKSHDAARQSFIREMERRLDDGE